MSNTIKKISVEKLNRVDDHAQMLFDMVLANKAKGDPNVAFQQAVTAVLVELIGAIKGEDR